MDKQSAEDKHRTERGFSRKDFLRLGGAGIAGVALVVGCSPIPGGGGGGGNGESEPISTDVGEMGEVTLDVWDWNTGAGAESLDAVTERLNEEFSQDNSNITIERTARPFEDLMQSVRLAASGNNPPNAANIDYGRPNMGALIEGGLLASLDEYAEAYGWNERFPESLLEQTTFANDGAEYGTGSLFGLPYAAGSTEGIYYNKSVLNNLGLELPTTLEEFENSLKAAAEAGEIPIQIGNLEQYPMINILHPIMCAINPVEYLRDFVYARNNVSFDTPETLEAVAMLGEWVENGYFTPGFNGISYDDSLVQFADGNGLYRPGNSISLPDLEADLGDDLGFFLIPPREGNSICAVGSAYGPFCIPINSEDHDAAAAYIDFICSDRAMELMAENDIVPVVPPEEAPDLEKGTARAEAFQLQSKLMENDAFVPYFSWSMPTTFDVVFPALQQFVAGEISVEQFIETTQTEYAKMTDQG